MDVVDPYKDEAICQDPVYKSDHNGCTVVAFTQVFSCSYKDAFDYIKGVTGRKVRTGLSRLQVESIFKNLRRCKYVKGPYSKSNRISINKFIKAHPRGRYYCLVRGHAIAIIDGVLYDHNPSKRRLINTAYRVYLEGEI